jgi:hypothetical protein
MTKPVAPELPGTNKETFFGLAQGLFLWLTTTFMTWVDDTATAMNFNSTNDVSSSSVVIGTGSKSLTVSPSKSYWGGMYVVISDNTTPGTSNSVNSMTAQVTSYNSGTGALVVNVLKFLGSGTKAAWTISQTAMPSPEVSGAMQAVTSQATLAAGRDAFGVKQQQSIDYTLAANALTLKLNPTNFDFRSTSLTSGTPTNVANAAQITTTISSGSTGGTINGVSSDIVLLAINNAGTMELAWTNLAGGLLLDETGLINTVAEGGAGAADSLGVIYSTTARTGVPYRVAGIFRSAQTSAGVWAQAPALVQGAGALAMVRRVVTDAAMPAFSAKRTGAPQSVAASSFVKVQCQTEDYDKDSSYDNITNFRYTAKVKGVHSFKSQVAYSGSTGSVRALSFLYLNNVEKIRGLDLPLAASSTQCHGDIDMNVGDYVELYTYIIATTAVIDATYTYFQGLLARAE